MVGVESEKAGESKEKLKDVVYAWLFYGIMDMVVNMNKCNNSRAILNPSKLQHSKSIENNRFSNIYNSV